MKNPERLLLVESDPLTVVVNGFHANHTVVRMPSGLICSCDRFRRGGGQCPHILAVERRFLDSDNSLHADEIADFINSATQRRDDRATSTDGLLDHVLTAVWDVSANASALMLSRGLVRAAGGQLTF